MSDHRTEDVYSYVRLIEVRTAMDIAHYSFIPLPEVLRALANLLDENKIMPINGGWVRREA